MYTLPELELSPVLAGERDPLPVGRNRSVERERVLTEDRRR